MLMDVRYEERSAGPPLDRFVECVWFLSAPRRPAAPPPERVVPDGCPELVFQFADPCLSGRPGEALHRQPPALLVGPLTSSILVGASGAVSTMGVRFRPGGLPAFVAAPLDELADRQVVVEDLFGAAARGLHARLAEAPDDSRRVAIVERFLMGRLADAGRPRRPVEHAVRRMVRRRGPVGIERLADDLGVSRRHLERTFRAETGMTPMLLGRMIRFQSVFRRLTSGEPDWISVALDCGYYDQSHLYRDFREFAAATPTQFVGEQGAFDGAFVSRERLERFFAY
jgi:AraC-like DNA-binding protein